MWRPLFEGDKYIVLPILSHSSMSRSHDAYSWLHRFQGGFMTARRRRARKLCAVLAATSAALAIGVAGRGGGEAASPVSYVIMGDSYSAGEGDSPGGKYDP